MNTDLSTMPQPWLHPDSLSPDPTYGDSAPRGARGVAKDIHPHAAVWTNAPDALPASWLRRLHLLRPAPAVTVRPRLDDTTEWVFDFGTEIEASLHLTLATREGGCVVLTFGESPYEAREFGAPSTCPDQRPRKQAWHFGGAGEHALAAEVGGFRFARVQLIGFTRPLRLLRLFAHATFTFTTRVGDFSCSDPLWQRIWQSSVYTARLCSRPDDIWDGIKRDRLSWCGDARVSSATNDLVWRDPRPGLGALATLRAGEWCNGIPVFSFEGLSLLRHAILCHGSDLPEAGDLLSRVRDFMTWVLRTQVSAQGYVVRRSDQKYFFDIGFLDWTPMPRGGRFEELGWLQCAWLQALETAADIAQWFGDSTCAAAWRARATALRPRLRRRFWTPGVGPQHTLNVLQPGATWLKPFVDHRAHYLGSYEQGLRGGPSGPSRHAVIRAVFAGLATRPADVALCRALLTDPHLPDPETSYYRLEQSHALALAGDAPAAFLDARAWLGAMLEGTGSATVWESFEPDVTGLPRWSLHAWPKSLCHGWGSGAVAFTARHLAGVRPLAPGYAQVALHPLPETFPFAFELTLSTPRGPLRVHRDERGRTAYRLPKGVTALPHG